MPTEIFADGADKTELYATMIIHTLKVVEAMRAKNPNNQHRTTSTRLKEELFWLATEPDYDISPFHGGGILKDVHSIDPGYSIRVQQKMIEALENLSES